MRHTLPIFFAGILFLSACKEQGLDPNDAVEPGFGGTITVNGPIPPADSLFDLRIVAVPYYPIDTLVQPLILKVVGGEIPFSENYRPRIASGAVITYDLFVRPKTYHYIAVVQQYGIDVFSQWRVVGVYGQMNTSQTPLSVTVGDGKFIRNINITVDFYRLPPQPFRTP